MKSDAVRRGIRTLLQFIVAGGLTAIVNQLANGMSANTKVIVQGINMLLVTVAQNLLEDNTAFPAILKAPPSSGQNPVPNEDAQV